MAEFAILLSVVSLTQLVLSPLHAVFSSAQLVLSSLHAVFSSAQLVYRLYTLFPHLHSLF